jgi:hypothetical protein
MEQCPFALQGCCHLHLEPLLKVSFPRRIIRVGLCLNLHVSLDRCIRCFDQMKPPFLAILAFPLSIETVAVTVLGLKVFGKYPATTLVMMPAFGPPPQGPKYLVIDVASFCRET